MAETRGLAPARTEIHVERDGAAFLVLGGIRAIKADSLVALLAQLKLAEDDTELA